MAILGAMHKMNSAEAIRWLHISDFHVKSGDPYDRDRVLNALIGSIPKILSRTGQIDFIVASGDIAYSGKQEEYDRITSFFDQILSDTGLPKARLAIIPGNHDVDRAKSTGLARTLDSQKEIDSYLTGDKEIPHISIKQASYREWYEKFFEGERHFEQRSTCQNVIMSDVKGLNIGFCLINTAAFCADDYDHGKIIIGRRCLEGSLSDPAFLNCDLKFVVSHHPLSWINPLESANIKALIQDKADLYLSGHLHETDVEQSQGVNGSVLYLTAGASYQHSDWPNTAMVCSFLEHEVTILPIQYVDRPRDAWTVDPAVFPDSPDFSRSYKAGSADFGGGGMALGAVAAAVVAWPVASVRSEWIDQLFTTVSGAPIYIEPRIMDGPPELAAQPDTVITPISIASIVGDSESYFVESRPECGASNLGKRLVFEVASAGGKAVIRNCRTMPNYKSKILSNLSEDDCRPDNKFTIVLDNFDPERDDRLLKELYSSAAASRVIMLYTNRDANGSTVSDVANFPFAPKKAYIWPLSREGVREVVRTVFDSSDQSFISATVDKVYSDLLALCIPLTAPNVVMYARILAKEGDFSPLNRVHIQSRYISESLTRSSDSYVGSFNYKNKMDVISAFTYKLYVEERTEFSSSDWFTFCNFHKKERLKEFDEVALFGEMQESRILIKYGSQYYFRYSFFYHFFLGRYLAAQRDLLEGFLAAEKYMEVQEVVDVITGLETGNADILNHLTDKLNRHLDEFAQSYVRADYDPLLPALWPDQDDEEEKLWKPVHKALENGPNSATEIDRLKTSILAEIRTQDQQVRFQKFKKLEHSLFIAASLLADALRNSDDSLGTIKLAALDAILRSELVAFQVGTMFADKLASRKYFRWGSVLFVDFNSLLEEGEDLSFEVVVDVICSLGYSVCNKVSEEIGTFKLSNVFRERAKSIESIGFLDLLLFACVLEAKGESWTETLQAIIEKTNRDAFYLQVMLNILMRNLSVGMVRVAESNSIKRLIAIIHSKRGHNKMAPGERLIKKVLNHLEKQNVFDVPSKG